MNLDINAWRATDKQKKEVLNYLKQAVDKLVEEGSKGLIPVLAVLCYDPLEDITEVRVHFMDTDFNSNLGKKKSMKMVAASIYDSKRVPLAIGLSCEAWSVEHKKGCPDPYKQHLTLGDHPDRQEIAMLSVLGFPVDGPSAKNFGICDRRVMQRDTDDTVSWDGPWMSDNPEQAEMFNGMKVECGILDKFYLAWIGFALKHENYRDYLDGAKVEQLEIPVR